MTFIGGWRPEREAVLAGLAGLDLKIWGPEWDRRCAGNAVVLKAWQGRPLVGTEFATAVAASKVNLNIIDPTNHPAANMRFFEIPVAGGLQVCSACPEMSGVFRDGEEIFTITMRAVCGHWSRHCWRRSRAAARWPLLATRWP